ncbi:hypothetical protein TAEQ797_02065 [Taylorella equigenitalis]
MPNFTKFKTTNYLLSFLILGLLGGCGYKTDLHYPTESELQQIKEKEARIKARKEARKKERKNARKEATKPTADKVLNKKGNKAPQTTKKKSQTQSNSQSEYTQKPTK